MGNQFNEIMQKLRAQRVRARRYTAMLLVLAMLTSLSVSWRLHQVGTALTTDNEYSCGMEEHVHTDDCYTEELVCGYEEGEPEDPDSAFSVDSEPTTEKPEAEPEEPEPEETEPEVHHHTADCYETVLVEHKELTCGQEEHTHDVTCPVDPDTGDFLCGYEEHTHTDDCYTTETETEEKLICGYEEGEVLSDGTAAEDGIAALEDTNTATSVAEDSSSEAVSEPVLHHHTEACYEKVLTCTIPEHTHTLECLADYSADVETDDDWEKYSVGLSDNWNEALLTVAKEQLGYKESEKNFQTDEALGDIIDVHHYTRYGAFYGNPYADWDVAFIAFCQHYAGIPKTEIPQRLGLEALRADMDAMGFAYLTEGEDAAYEAIPGDVVTYNKNGTADDETIGIVETVGDDSLTVISGAVEGAVAEVTVPFTDVTSTILVDQAYGDYVGEAGDRDGSHDDEIAVQPAEEKDATAVDASEVDIFNTTDALDLNKGENQKKVKLSFTLENKPGGKNWEKIPDGSEIQEGAEVRLVLHMGLVPKGTFSDATNGNKAYYQLPYKLAEQLTDKPIYKEGSTTEVIGHLNVNTDGLAVITFDKVQGFDYRDSFTATINVSGYIVAGGTGATEDFSLSDGTHFTLKKKSDIKTDKSAAAEVVEKGDKTYFKYTVKVSSQNGTAGQPVKIDDVITNLYNLTGSYDENSFKLTKKDGAVVDLTHKLTFASNGKSFKIEELEALGKDDYYELTYLYEVNGANNFTTEKWGTVENTATATSGENRSPDDAKKSLSRDDITVEKYGAIGGYGNDQAVGKITWTVTINNPNGRDLKDYVVDDALKTSGITIREGDKVKIEESTDSYNFHDFKVAGEKQYGTINAQHTGFTYTFPEGSTGKKYRFTYYTTMPNGTDGTKDVINGVDVKKGEKTYHAEGTVQNAVREKKLLKDSSGKLETVSPGKMQEKKWNIAVRTDASVGKRSSFTVTDTFQKPTIGGAEATGLKHYAVKSTLEQELKDSIKFYWVSGENSGKASYSDLTKSEFGGVKINIEYYKANREVATEDTDEVTSFKITVDWTNATGKNENLVITQLNAESYSSYVEDVSSLQANQTLTVTNQVEYGNGLPVRATSSYTKPAAGNPQLVKLASGDVYSGFNKSASVEYGKVIWFKLILKNMTDNTVTVTDTLPKGLKFDPNDNRIGDGSPYYVGFSMNDSDGINASNLVPLDGTGGSQVPSRQGVGYLTVSAADYEQGKKQQVTFELKNLNEAQVNNTKGKPIAIIFGVRVDDDRWDNIDFTQDTYPNTATWSKGGKGAQANVTVQRTDFGLWKTAKQSSDKNAATYTVEINKDGKQWLSTLGSELELHDTLTIPAKIDAEINRQSVKLEKYVNGVLTDVKATDLLRFTLEPMQNDGTNKVYKMTFAVPDGCYYKLTYEYRFLVGDNSVGTQEFPISNKVDMFGHGETNKDYRYHYEQAGGIASQTNTNTLQLFKVERNKHDNALPGATFKLSKWESTGWSEVKANCTTDADGQILFRYANPVSGNVVKVDRGVLYRLEETAAPSGYIGDSTYHYFLMLDANQTKENPAITNVVQKSGVPESQITFVAANQTEQMYVENTAKQITIRKVWQDANGKQEKNVDHEPITVKITRYQDGREDKAWPPKSITLSSDNSWTYIYPDSSNGDAPLDDNYTYAVEEENVPYGYNVSYTDQNGNETNTGFTSGDTVVIKNMQKSGWLKVEKKWLAEDGKTALTDLPEGTAITLKLYEVDGEANPVDTKTLKKDDGSNWKWTFTGLNENAQYYVVEDPQVAGFKVTYSHTDLNAAPTGSTVTVTNTKKRTETTLEVVKLWQDSDGKPLTENLPTEITLILYEKGTNQEVAREKVKPDADGNWKYTFTGLDPDAQYYVVEETVDGYTVSYTSDVEHPAKPGDTITVTNRKNAPGYELPATGSTGTAPYTTAGVVLMGAALVGGYRRKRRQERRGE